MMGYAQEPVDLAAGHTVEELRTRYLAGAPPTGCTKSSDGAAGS